MRSINNIAFIIGLMSFPFLSFGQIIDLGTAENFMLYSCSGAVTNSGVSSITGDVGANVGAISGFGTITGSFYNADAVTAQVKTDVIYSYNLLASIPPTVTSHAGAFGSETLNSGVYTIAGIGSLAGNLTLDGLSDSCSMFVFRFGGAFSTGTSSSITLINGAQACNVFWLAEGAISLASPTIMKGTMIANNGAVTATAGCDIDGRLFSTLGAITIGTSTGNIPICLSSCTQITPPPVLDCCMPDFGGTINFMVYTSSGAVTNSGVSDIIGNIGSDLGLISGFGTSTVTGSFYNANSKTAKTKIDVTDLYNQLFIYPTTHGSHAPAFGSGETLTKGVYDISGAGSVAGIITLDAENDPDAVFVFRFGGAFEAAAASSVVLINGAQACSVFWVVNGAVSAGAGSNMIGTYLVNNGAVAIGANSTLEGRLFSTGGAITLDQINGNISAPCRLPGCCTITSTWHGSVSTDWFNNSNWNAGTPNSNVNALIPSGRPNMPIISLPNASCKNLDINTFASTSLSGSNGIDIYGDWTNNGTFNGNAGTVTLKGFSGNNIISASNQLLKDLTIDNESVATISSGSIELTGELDIVSGNLTTNNSLTLISDVSGTARINELSFKCKYTLDMFDSWGDDWNGGSVTVLVDGVSIGNFYCKGGKSQENLYIPNGSNFQLQYSSGSFEDENSYTLKNDAGTILFSDGPTPTAGTNVFSTVSNGSVLDPITGNITMQRYIDAGATNWRFLTSAVTGATLAQFNDDFITSGFPGSGFPNWPTTSNPWPSIYSYDETQVGEKNIGFMPATNTTNAISPGQGFWVWCGTALLITQHFTIDFTGPPNTGAINLPLTYTNSGNTGDGWNMTANPYPSTIDWDSPNISKTNINDAIYIWNPNLEQFASYVSGIGTNGGSNNIASSQGFWVQANSTGAAIQVSEASKTVVDGAFIKQVSAVPLRIKTSNAYGADELAINFRESSSAGFDIMFDAKKVPSTNINLPLTSSVVNGTDCSINQLNYQERDIPIKILCGITGTHIIQIENGLDFTSSSCLFLEDLFTGISYDLSEIDSFSTTIYDTTQTARYLLHIGAPVDIIQTDANCFGNASASIIYSKNSSSPFDITWKDNLNNIIAFNSSVNTKDSITNLMSGTYFIESTDAICDNRIDTVIVQQPDEIITQFISDIDTVYLATGGAINFTNQSVNGNSYLWDFGDFNSSVISSPLHQYSSAGIYNVTLNTYQNLLCSKEAAKKIFVIEQNPIEIDAKITPNIWINNNELIVTGSNLDKIEIRNVIGQLLIESHSLSNNKTFLNLGNLNSQVLMVSVFSENKGFTAKVIFIKK